MLFTLGRDLQQLRALRACAACAADDVHEENHAPPEYCADSVEALPRDDVKSNGKIRLDV